MSKRTARVLQWLVGIALVALFLVLGDTSQLGRLRQVSWPWLVGLLLTTIGLVMSSAGRWRRITTRLAGGGSGSLTQYAYYFVIGRALGFVFPAEITDVGVRTLALRRSERFSLAGAAYTVLLDRLFDLVVLVCLVVPALLHLGGRLDESTALGAGFAGIVLLPLAVGRWHRTVIQGLTRLFARLVESLRVLPGIRAAGAPELGGATSLDRKDSALLYGLSVFKVTMVVARFYCIAGALSVPMPLAKAFVLVPLAQVAALVAVTPGGLGILEAGWYGILVWGGFRGEETVLLVIGWRLYTFASLLCLALGLRVWEFVAGRRA